MNTLAVMCMAFPDTVGAFLIRSYAFDPELFVEKEVRPEFPPEVIEAYSDILPVVVRLRERLSISEVIEKLNEMGFRTRSGKKWKHPTQICRLTRIARFAGITPR